MNPAEYGVVLVAVFLLMKEIFNFILKMRNPPEKKEQTSKSDIVIILDQISQTLSTQNQILQKSVTILTNHDSRFREFVEDFKTHERAMSHR